MHPFNPYAPPTDPSQGHPHGPYPPPFDPSLQPYTVTREALEEARAQLDAYLANPANLAAEARLRGPRIRRVTWILSALAVALCAASGALAVAGVDTAPAVLFVVGLVFVLVAIVAGALDLRVPRRDQPGAPDACLKGYLMSLRFARSGYGVSCIAPSARNRLVPAPNLAPAVSGPGAFTLNRRSAMLAYARTFAAQGHGLMHLFAAKKVRVLSDDGTFAQVEAEVQAYSWPQWVTYVGAVAVVVAKLLGAVVYLALYYSLRKGGQRVVRKWVIRGSDGVYYLFDGDIVGP